MAIGTVVLAIIAAVMYAGTQFVKKVPTDKPEEFDINDQFLDVVIFKTQ